MLLLAHAALTWALCGLILTVQWVHYPLFARVGDGAFVPYELEHTRRITALVGPLMLGELLTGAVLAWRSPPSAPAWAVWLGLALIALIWGMTALVQSPLHGRLSRGWDERAWRALVRSNWGRTALWLARGLLVGWLLARQAGMIA